ncbi:MAG: outer membrane beta-barrel protein [Flavipsychrobacter sp.]|nr:outer membrane beta-barrel protein [Flavipsychrobacter sp.]
MKFYSGAVLFFFIMLLLSAQASGQGIVLSGRVVDKKDAAALSGVTVMLVSVADSTKKTGTVTGTDGDFSVSNIPNGKYLLVLRYVSYRTVRRSIEVAGKDIAFGTLEMEASTRELKGVTVSGRQIRGEQKGDTSQFNADAYKTNPDATAEELAAKMPGITSDNTGVKVNGEAVQQVLVDGKPFFGTDPTLALKNLPAEVIDKIQVFDKLSDQSMFTGFDDGNAQKTMNIITRRNKSEGVFGKVYAGYGTDDRYLAGGNMNFFNGDRRITILGLANNINQQNFSQEDVLGLGGGQGRGGRGPGGRGGGGSSNNFMVGQQGGISATNSLGVNYSDTWGKKVKVSGSYFFNGTDNNNDSRTSRTYFAGPSNSSLYDDNSLSSTKNLNHRFNMRLEYTIDSANSITFSPSLSLQHNDASTSSYAKTTAADILQSSTNNATTLLNDGYNASGNLLYQHKFRKPRRTISVNVNGGANEKIGEGTNYSQNSFYNSVVTGLGRDQRYDLQSDGTNVSTNLTYTEPIGKKGQLQFSYNPSFSGSASDKMTYSKDAVTGDYSKQDTLFSNIYANTYTTQKGGVSFRVGERDKKTSFNVGVNVQQANLAGDQEFPAVAHISRSFFNVLPNAFYNYRAADGRNMRVMYRTNTNAPSITQLQSVVDISNPLLMRTGNADLKQSYEHTFVVRYGLTKAKTGRNLFLNIYANKTFDYIGSSVYQPSKDSLFADKVSGTSILINRGSQISRPVNLDGYFSSRFFITYGFPVGLIKSNLNLNAGLNYNITPGLVNDVVNKATNYVPSFGAVLSSNISDRIDFTVSYTGNYNVVSNSIQSQVANNFYNHVASVRFNWVFLENFVFNTNFSNNYYTGFSGTGAQNFNLWGAYVGYKMWKKTLEARISVYDILNQNTSVARTVTETYFENANTNVLRQYFMAQLTYTIRKFKSGAPPEPEKQDDMMRHRDNDFRRRGQ